MRDPQVGEISVTSEISPLRKVVVHAPGREWDLIPAVPGALTHFLIEDIFVLDQAQTEHGCLTSVLREFIGDDQGVIQFTDLLAEVCANEERRAELVSAVAGNGYLGEDICKKLLSSDLPPEKVAEALICGTILADRTERSQYQNRFSPIPNLLFTRDLGAAIADGFIIGHPAKPARRREALLMRHVLRGTRLFLNARVYDIRTLQMGKAVFWAELISWTTEDPSAAAFLEGGDILVLNENTLMIGTSERTTKDGLYLLILSLAEGDSQVTRVIRALMPEQRQTMHLDTVLTATAEGEVLLFSPDVRETIQFVVYEYPFVKRDRFAEAEMEPLSWKELVAHGYLGSLQEIECGGPNRLFQMREQWTDGTNVLAIAPGLLLGYDRNTETAGAFQERGYTYLKAGDQSDYRRILEAASRYRDGNLEEKLLIGLPGSELSRARGGSHCMTLPIRRDPYPVVTESRASRDDTEGLTEANHEG